MKKIICLILTCITLASFASCDAFITKDNLDPNSKKETEAATNGSSENNAEEYTNTNGDTVVIDNIDNMDENRVVPLTEPEMFSTPFADNQYIYYYLKLGEIYSVPVHSEIAQLHNGVETIYEWSQKTTYSNIYQESTQNAASFSTKESASLSVSTELSGKLGVSYKGIKADIGVSAKTALSTSLESTQSVISTQTFTKTVNNTVTDTQSCTIKLGKDDKVGYYRYTIYADYDVYAVVACDYTNNQIEYTYISVPKSDSLKKAFRYNKDGEFDQVKSDEKLQLTEDVLKYLPADPFDVDNAEKTSGYVYASLSAPYKNTNSKRKITDSGNYGLNQRERDNIDISELKDYIGNDNYVFLFEVSIRSSRCKNILGIYISGYREALLYNKENSKLENLTLDDESAADKFGWLDVYTWSDHDSDIQDFVWKVDGSKCAETMYVRYDAHGEDFDDWYLDSIEVMVRVVQK